MRGSFPLRGIFSTVSLRRRQESRFHIFILSVAKDLLLAQQQILRRLRLLRMTAPANRVTIAKLGHHRPLGSGSGSGLPTTRPSVVEFVNTGALQEIYPAFPLTGSIRQHPRIW